jgi:(p)ppGpp synthase/HD superfamily hydrolase
LPINCEHRRVSDCQRSWAILHDTVEDTGSTFSELEKAFGHDVRLLVEEVTDDKASQDERKRLQIAHALNSSERAN